MNKFILERGVFQIMGSKERFFVDIMALNSGVTGSGYPIVVNYPNGYKTQFLLECGLFEGKDNPEDERAPFNLNESFPFNANNVEFCIISHNHVDHTGRLPLLAKQGFDGKVYTSKETGILLPLALGDSYKVLKELAKRKHCKELYSEADVSNILDSVKTIDFSETMQIDSHTKVTLFKNGHLVGAAFVLLQIQYEEYEDINILFTGDYNTKNVFFDIPKLPKYVLDMPLTIIQESTYGTTDSTEIVECFEKNILECISNNGTSVNMAFSLGRFQEILYKLKQMQDSGELSTDIPIYADGKLGIRYTYLFTKGKLGIKDEALDFLPKNLTFVSKDNREDVLESEECKIIVSTSGMGTYGPAPQYIIKFIRNKKNLIQFTGFTPEGTLGYRLKCAQDGDVVQVGGMSVVKKAKVEHTTEFSAHAKADEMISFLRQFNNIKLVLVNHGDSEVKEAFAKRIVQEVGPKDVGILGREYLYRIGAYGIIKTMTTKFE